MLTMLKFNYNQWLTLHANIGNNSYIIAILSEKTIFSTMTSKTATNLKRSSITYQSTHVDKELLMALINV